MIRSDRSTQFNWKFTISTQRKQIIWGYVDGEGLRRKTNGSYLGFSFVTMEATVSRLNAFFFVFKIKEIFHGSHQTTRSRGFPFFAKGNLEIFLRESRLRESDNLQFRDIVKTILKSPEFKVATLEN